MAYFMRIDLHGHTTESASRMLTDTLRQLPPDVREVEVVHGFHQGTALREMIRRFRHPKIERKIRGMNQGVTILVIKQP